MIMQTVQTLLRGLLQEPSEQGLHCLHWTNVPVSYMNSNESPGLQHYISKLGKSFTLLIVLTDFRLFFSTTLKFHYLCLKVSTIISYYGDTMDLHIINLYKSVLMPGSFDNCFVCLCWI